MKWGKKKHIQLQEFWKFKYVSDFPAKRGKLQRSLSWWSLPLDWKTDYISCPVMSKPPLHSVVSMLSEGPWNIILETLSSKKCSQINCILLLSFLNYFSPINGTYNSYVFPYKLALQYLCVYAYGPFPIFDPDCYIYASLEHTERSLCIQFTKSTQTTEHPPSLEVGTEPGSLALWSTSLY